MSSLGCGSVSFPQSLSQTHRHVSTAAARRHAGRDGYRRPRDGAGCRRRWRFFYEAVAW